MIALPADAGPRVIPRSGIVSKGGEGGEGKKGGRVRKKIKDKSKKIKVK